MDIVVTVPKEKWDEWIAEGDCAGDDPESGREYVFTLRAVSLPNIRPGERVYIVAHGKLRGYAPLTDLQILNRTAPHHFALVRRGGAVAVTLNNHERVTGFRGYRYRWWDRKREIPFPEWKTP